MRSTVASARPRLWGALLLLAALAVALISPAPQAAAISPNIVISQVYGGGGNSGATYRQDFVELFNRGTTSASLAGWSIQYASATGSGNFGSSATQLTELPAVTLQPGQYYLVQQAQGAGGTTDLPAPDLIDPSPIAMSGTGGKVALVSQATSLGCNGGTVPCSPAQLALIVDLIGWDGANFFEGAVAPATTNTTAVARNANGCQDTDNNAADFATGAPAPRNMGTPLAPCGGPPPNAPVTISCPAALTAYAGFAASAALTASDADGTVTTFAITSGGAPTIGLTGITPAGAPGGAASATLEVSAATPAGSYPVQVTASNSDATPQSASCTVNVTVNTLDIKPIGVVQGSVGDGDSGTAHRSIFAAPSGNGTGQTVQVQGVIYQKLLSRTSSGGVNNGFLIQNTAATADGDSNSSDGIFVFMGGNTSLIGGYTPQVGDEVLISGRVSEYFNLTQLSSASLLALVRSGVDLEAELLPVEVNPPDDLSAANRYWERLEGMRLAVPAGAVTVDGRDVFASTWDAEIWLMRGDHPVAARSDPYARRVFRDPHPLDNVPDVLFDDGNGYRIMIASYGIKQAAGDSLALLPPARTFETLTNRLVGGLYYTFSKYAIMTEQMPAFQPGVDPAANNPPTAIADRAAEFSLATFNLENLYDYRDDPFDGCDFAGNGGCPGVSPPFDYVPASQEAYDARLADIASQIVNDLHSPDILMVQEVEDQDYCVEGSGALVCGPSDNADGEPDPLQDLANAILAAGGPAYDSAYDRDGSDDRGIVAAFLYRSDRAELLPADAGHPVLGSSPAVSYRGAALAYNADVQNPKALNAELPADVETGTGTDGTLVFTRDPQVGLFRIWKDGIGSGSGFDLYAISNHFSSTPSARVGQRTEQAAYNAAIVAALQAVHPETYVAVGGDFNVYPRPDDGVDPMSPLFPSDQLGPLYNVGLQNLYDVALAEAPAAAYSYVFQGQTQTLDQIFVTPSLLGKLKEARVAHVNADFAADFDGDVARGTSDHDPTVARICRDVTPPSVTVGMSPNVLWPANHQMVRVVATVATSDDSATAPVITFVSVTSNEPDNGLGDGDTAGDIVVVDSFSFDLRAERSGTGDGRVYTITYSATDACGNVGTGTGVVNVPKSQGRVKGGAVTAAGAGPSDAATGTVRFLPLVSQ